MFAQGAASWFVPPLAAGGLALGVGLAASWALMAVVGGGVLVLGLFLMMFFRDPERAPGQGVVSAADGRVILVDEVEDSDVGSAWRVAVFMSPFDVHVNRSPAGGRVERITHRAGGYLPAFRKESERNERVEVVWATDWGRIKTVQIAGAVARRIVPYVEQGAVLEKAQRFGLIRFGSRVDHLVPRGVRPRVRVGDRVRAGRTTVAE